MLRWSFSNDATVSTFISGKDLLALVKDNPEAHKHELASMAGYFRTTRKGEEVVNIPAFTEALLEAKGVVIRSETRGRAAASETTVHSGGGILIGSIYAKMAGVGPGDVYSITVNEGGQIVLDVIMRVEGSPLPFKVYDRKPKDDAKGADAEKAKEPVT
jgi:hypothetical protein